MLQQVEEDFHIAADDVELHAGILPDEGLGRLGDNVRERVGHADIQLARNHLLEIADAGEAVFGILKRPLGVGEQVRPGFREEDVVAVPLEKRNAEFVLQLPYLLRKGPMRFFAFS